MNNYCTLFVVRHGETDWNVKRKVMGHKDLPLNETGIIQANELAKELKKIHFDAIFSSDLLRAKQTAKIISLERKIAVQTTTALRERYFGRLEGKSWVNSSPKLQKLWEMLSDLTDTERKKHNLEKVENDMDVISRFIIILREISVAHIGKTVLIACHGGLMRMLLQHLGFIPKGLDPDFLKMKPKTWINILNTSYIILESDGVDFFIKKTKGIG